MKLANTPNVLLEKVAPNASSIASVEEQDGVIYLYCRGTDEFETAYQERVCWVRNLRPGPAESPYPVIREGDMPEGPDAFCQDPHGAPPLLPAPLCVHPAGAAPPDPDALKLVFLEQCDGVALLENEEILAVIREWTSESSSRIGFARDCLAPSPLCLPLRGYWEAEAHGSGGVKVPAVVDRVRSAQAVWDAWRADVAPWGPIRETLLATYTAAFGTEPRIITAFDKHWPPRELAVYDTETALVVVTVGLSVLQQGLVHRYEDDCWYPPRRIELAFAIARDEYDDTQLDETMSWVGGHGVLPWRGWSWLGDGHVFKFHSWPVDEEKYPATMLFKSPGGAPKVTLQTPAGEPVELLWMLPIMKAELDLIDAEGPDALTDSWELETSPWPHRAREPIRYWKDTE